VSWVCVDPWVVKNRLQCVKLVFIEETPLPCLVVACRRDCSDNEELTMAFPFGIVNALNCGGIGGGVHRKSFGSLFCSPVPVKRAYSLQYSSKKVLTLSLTLDRSRSRCFLLHSAGSISSVNEILIFMFSGCCGLVGGKVGETGGKGRKDGKEHGAKRHKVPDLLRSVPSYKGGAFLVVHRFIG
jgi:hypothetical protein